MFTPNLHLFYLVFSAYISLHTALLKESILCICWQCFIVWNQQNNSLCKTPYPYPKSRSSLTCTVQPPLAFFFWKRQVLVVILKPTFPFAFVLEIHLLQKKQFFLLREFIYNLCNLRCAGSQAFSYIVSYCNFFPFFSSILCPTDDEELDQQQPVMRRASVSQANEKELSISQTWYQGKSLNASQNLRIMLN